MNALAVIVAVAAVFALAIMAALVVTLGYRHVMWTRRRRRLPIELGGPKL